MIRFCIVVGLGFGFAACDQKDLARAGLVPGVRAEVVAACCDCLRNAAPPPEEAACDAGTCICEHADDCETRLLDGETVVVEPSCTLPGGACRNSCREVLAFSP